eukprot:COSAG06_NODE_3390_length_5413_cov_5.050997_6_plen_463_part_00
MEQVASPAFESENESEKDSSQDREPRVAAAPWWAALDERAAALLAAKCHGTATVELRDEAAEPHSFDMGTFVFIFLENLLMPLSIMPRFCSGRGRRGLVGKSYLPATKAFSADDELLWSLKLTRSGFGASKVHSLFFGNAWPSTVGLVYCGIRWWDDATTRYFFLLNCLLQFMLRAQWAMKYAYRRKAAEQRLQNGTSLDRRAEELLFGFIPLAPWLSIVELRLAALAERMDLSQELVFRGGAADAEAMFPPHAMRWLPDAVCRPGGPDQAGAGSSDHTGWAAGRPKVDAERGEFSVTAAAVVFRALVHESRVVPIGGQPPIKVEFWSLEGGQDLLIMLCLFALGAVPLAAAVIEGGGQAIQQLSIPTLVQGGLYFGFAPLGVRGFLNAVFVNIRRRTHQQELMGALLSGAPSMAGEVATPRLVCTEQNLVAWLGCRAVLLRSFAGIQKRTEAMAGLVRQLD